MNPVLHVLCGSFNAAVILLVGVLVFSPVKFQNIELFEDSCVAISTTDVLIGVCLSEK